MGKLRERGLALMDVLQERGWSARVTARGLGVDKDTLRQRIGRTVRRLGIRTPLMSRGALTPPDADGV